MWTSFIGFMGSGKTTIAARLADLARRPLVDLDEHIASDAECDIPAIFAAEGEPGFRRRELAALRSLPENEALVVATGGGLVETREAVLLLRERGTVIWLDTPWSVLARRISASGDARPLVARLDEDGLAFLYRDRLPCYAAAADYRLDTGRMDPDRLLRTVVSILADAGRGIA